ERVAHPFTAMIALTFASALHLNNREPEEALKRLETAEALAAEQRLSFIVEPQVVRGAALVGLGAVDDATVQIRQGLTEWRRKGATFYLPFGFAFLADALVRRSEHAAAWAAAQEGLEAANATGEHVWDAELHRLAGMASLADNKIDQSHVCFEEALRVARG